MATQTITTDQYKLYPSPRNQYREIFEHQVFVPYPYAIIDLEVMELAGKTTLYAACRLSGLDPRIALESGSPHTIFSMAIGGVGIAILPSSIRALKTDLTVRPVAIDGHAIEFEISAIWSRSTPLPAYGRRFVAALAEHIAREQDGSAVSP